MKKKKFLLILFGYLFSIIIALIPSDLFSQSQAGQGGKIYFCLDNSASLKEKRFYENIVGHLQDSFSQLEEQGVSELTIILFGDSGQLPVFHITGSQDLDWKELYEKMGKTTYPITDFRSLLSFDLLRNAGSNDKIIILSDGEHDRETLSSFSSFTFKEKDDLSQIFNSSKFKAPLFSIHILYNSDLFKVPERNLSFMEGIKVETNPTAIAGLSKYFMKRITRSGASSTLQQYYPCNSNDQAIVVLTQLLELPVPETPHIKKEIDMKILFTGMPPAFQNYTREYFSGLSYCIKGENRTIRVFDASDSNVEADVTFEISDAGLGTVNVILNKKTLLLKETSVDFYNKDTRFLEDFKKKVKEIINEDPNFDIPKGSINVYISNPHVLSFIEANQYRIDALQRGCNSKQTPTYASAYHAVNNGFLLETPLNTNSLVFYLLNNNTDVEEDQRKIELFRTSLSSSDFDFWNREIRPTLQIPPSINISFDEVFKKNPGELFIYAGDSNISGDGNVYITRLTYSNPYFDFFKNFTYTFYYVPESKQYTIINESRNMSGFYDEITLQKTERYNTLIAVLSNRLQIAGFDNWRSCLDRFEAASQKTQISKDTQDENEKNNVIREILVSDVFFLLMYHLDEIEKDSYYKPIFIILLETIRDMQITNTRFPTAKLYKDINSEEFLKKRTGIVVIDKLRLIAENLLSDSAIEGFIKNGIIFLKKDEKESIGKRYHEIYIQLTSKDSDPKRGEQ